MLHARDYPPGSCVYTFVEPNGRNIHIDPIKLRAWCIENKPDVHLVPIQRSLLNRFIADNLISLDRVAELIERFSAGEQPDPVIFAQTGINKDGSFDGLLVDGRHRYAICCLYRIPLINAYVLPKKIWIKFRIFGLRELTQEQLSAAPLSPRNY